MAIKKGYTKITMVYDYVGIENWAIGEWRTNKAVSINYVIAISKLKKHIDIQFNKVKAHSGNEHNDRADFLARKAINLA